MNTCFFQFFWKKNSKKQVPTHISSNFVLKKSKTYNKRGFKKSFFESFVQDKIQRNIFKQMWNCYDYFRSSSRAAISATPRLEVSLRSCRFMATISSSAAGAPPMSTTWQAPRRSSEQLHTRDGHLAIRVLGQQSHWSSKIAIQRHSSHTSSPNSNFQVKFSQKMTTLSSIQVFFAISCFRNPLGVFFITKSKIWRRKGAQNHENRKNSEKLHENRENSEKWKFGNLRSIYGKNRSKFMVCFRQFLAYFRLFSGYLWVDQFFGLFRLFSGYF